MRCSIILQGGKHEIHLDMAAEEVANRLRANDNGFEAFEQKGGKSIYINVGTVLYVEDRSGGKATSW